MVIRGALVLPDRIIDDGSLTISDGRIVAVSAGPVDAKGARELDYRGCYILPGIVDSHIHARSTPAEGLARATAAAAVGGVTTVVDMPFDFPDPLTTVERLHLKREEIASSAYVDVGLYGTVAKRHDPSALAALVDSGVLALKVSLYEVDAHRMPRIDDGELWLIFSALAEVGLPIVVHAELEEIVRRLSEDEAAPGEPESHERCRPVVSETAAIAKIMEFALHSGARLHVAHVTDPHGFWLVRAYAGLGAHVTGEMCAHYLALGDEDVRRWGTLAKVNPPIRSAAARESLWKELRTGGVASISSDHAPWPLANKQKPMAEASSGIPGLETLLPVLWTEARRRDFPVEELVGYLSWRPAQIFGISNRKGSLEPGKDADFCVFDDREPWTFDARKSQSIAQWSPFDGNELAGRVRATWVRGRLVAEDGALATQPGYGELLSRDAVREQAAVHA